MIWMNKFVEHHKYIDKIMGVPIFLIRELTGASFIGLFILSSIKKAYVATAANIKRWTYALATHAIIFFFS